MWPHLTKKKQRVKNKRVTTVVLQGFRIQHFEHFSSSGHRRYLDLVPGVYHNGNNAGAAVGAIYALLSVSIYKRWVNAGIPSLGVATLTHYVAEETRVNALVSQ